MSKLLYRLFVIINQYGFLSVPVPALILLAVILGLDGYTLGDGFVIGAAAATLALFWWRFHARQTANVPDNTDALQETINQNGKYALLAFESEFCLSSTTVGQRLAKLETMYPEKFQIYSLSVRKDPGKELFQQYEGRVTPTYVLLDPEGKEVMNWPLVLPVDRVTYAVTQNA